MSGDETLVLISSLMAAVATWALWLRDVAGVARGRAGRPERLLLGLAPVACALVLAAVLLRLASADVRDDFVYLAFYLLLGMAWVGLGTQALAFAGLSARDDVLERGNRAAAVALAGGLLGITFCFAGGNVGNGPGWWVVVFCAALATVVLLLAWALLDRLAGAADAVTVDRDLAAGMRTAGFLAAGGLILGRAVAGDWTSAGSTVSDFARLGWPVLALVALAVVVERRCRPTAEAPERPVVACGAVPALAYAAVAAAAVLQAGPWT